MHNPNYLEAARAIMLLGIYSKIARLALVSTTDG